MTTGPGVPSPTEAAFDRIRLFAAALPIEHRTPMYHLTIQAEINRTGVVLRARKLTTRGPQDMDQTVSWMDIVHCADGVNPFANAIKGICIRLEVPHVDR